MVAPLRSQVRLRLSRLSVQHGRSASSHRPALTLARCSVAAHCALLRVLATPALRASDVRKLTRGAPCFTGLIDGYCSHWLRRLFRPHWAYYGLFPPQAAAFVRPPPVSAKILRIFGRGNCKETIFALVNGIFRRGVLRVHAPLNSAWSSHTFAPPCANACAVFRPCGLRFAPCPRGSSRFAASAAHKLACGTPCFIGVFVPACASLARYSGAAERFALSSPLHPFGASRQRPVSRTARGLRAPPPYTPPGTIEVRKGFASLFGFATVCFSWTENLSRKIFGYFSGTSRRKAGVSMSPASTSE